MIGEGGSGGALAISIADRILMLEYSIYSVAPPESAASILWRDNAFAPQAAEGMRISARELKALNLIDDLLPEPLGGAHRNPTQMAETLKETLIQELTTIEHVPLDVLLERRYQKFRVIGKTGTEQSEMPQVSPL